MSIGTGIFLSVVFLGCVFLYTKSEHKAKWRRCFLFFLAGILCVVVFFQLYFIIDEYIEKNSSPTDMKGIKLGETLSNLQFEHGNFKKTLTYEVTAPDGRVYKVISPERAAEEAIVNYLKEQEPSAQQWTSTKPFGVKEIEISDSKTIVKFPADMSDDSIKKVLRQQFPPTTRTTAPTVRDAKIIGKFDFNYYIADNGVIIYENDSKAQRLAWNCPANPFDDLTYFHLIQCNANSKDVLSAYGEKKVAIFCSDSDVETRLYEIKSKNIRLLLRNNRVKRIEFSLKPFPVSKTFNKPC